MDVVSKGQGSFEFNLPLAVECSQTFTASTGIGCQIVDPLGTVLHQNETSVSNCNFCRKLQKMTSATFPCVQTHMDSCFQAQRFGGKYIYLCPCGMTHFVALIYESGVVAAALVGGPVLMVEKSEYIQHDLLEGHQLDESCKELFLKELDPIPVVTPDRVSHFANLLFMLASFVSGYENYQQLEVQELEEQQSKISGYLQSTKKFSEEERPKYPLDKEKELLSAIAHGDKETSQRLLNEILGHILFGYGNRIAEIKTRITELIVLLSRAAIDGGADQDQIFGLNYRYLDEIHNFSTVDDLSYWLSKIMNKFTEYVFNMNDIKHIDVIYKALNYINNNYMKKISLEEVASQVYFSPSYFSKVFKDEMHCNFNTYLNQVRIEKSKKLLLSDAEKLVDIADMVGFEDQSYFSKVFKKTAGMTPGKFREMRGQRPQSKPPICQKYTNY